jgi:salicylate hydroxylase
MRSAHFLIAGGGIGGLASALQLGRAGHHVTLLEQASAFTEIGAGIQLGPNAMRLLTRWGLRDAVLARACTPDAVAVRDVATGRSIRRILLGAAAQQRYGEVYASLHRADLHAVLLDAVRAQPRVTLCTQEALQSFDTTTQGVTVHTDQRTLPADALIGADGVWSAVRRAVLHDGAPRDTRHAAYRALLPRHAAPAEFQRNEVGVWWGCDVHVVHYPVRNGDALNLVVLSNRPTPAEAAADTPAGWHLSASAATVQALLSDACAPLASLVHAAAQWQRWHLFDRAPTRGWSRGAVTLLGDAAHPMLPYLAQGASMALEDAQVLTDCVARAGDARTAFAQYENLRFARTARVVHTARRNALIFHLPTPWSLARDAVLALQGTDVLGMSWLYGHDVSVL